MKGKSLLIQQPSGIDNYDCLNNLVPLIEPRCNELAVVGISPFNSFFSFDESLLDAESSLEHVLDTNITIFLRRF